eukprot:15359713-Heterocapsa_arctica.AAC.1
MQLQHALGVALWASKYVALLAGAGDILGRGGSQGTYHWALPGIQESATVIIGRPYRCTHRCT